MLRAVRQSVRRLRRCIIGRLGFESCNASVYCAGCQPHPGAQAWLRATYKQSRAPTSASVRPRRGWYIAVPARHSHSRAELASVM